MIAKAAIGLLGSALGMFGDWGKQKQQAALKMQERMERTWTDEILVVYWFSPTVVAWFDPARSIEMQNAMFATSDLVAIQIGITTAVFGLGKLKR